MVPPLKRALSRLLFISALALSGGMPTASLSDLLEICITFMRSHGKIPPRDRRAGIPI